MNLDELTPAQREAVTSDGSNILVSAGAGSGKTQVLTTRVVYFVKEKHYKLDQFLILTFTKLAAGEMKKRIREMLNDEKLFEATNQVDSANISTFDSYALNLVKKYHFLLKVSPNVSIVDKTIIDVKKRRIIEDIFERSYKEKDKGFLDLISHFCLKDDKDIRKLVLDVYDKALLQIDTKWYLNNFEDIYYSNAKFEEIIGFIVKKIKDLSLNLSSAIENIPSSVSLKDRSASVIHYASDLFSLFFKATTYDELLSTFSSFDLDPKEGDFSVFQWSCKNWSLEANEAMKKFKEAKNGLVEFMSALPKTKEEAFEDLSETKPYAKTITKIIKELDERISEYKTLNGAYEFTDIAKMAYRLVKENEEVREEIKSSLKMIMIDEYQDTSSLQDNFIKEIASDNVYMVGDVKQSIYRFRNAEVSIFIDKYRDYKQNGTGRVIDMNKNFRSRKEVLDDINYIFKQLMSEKYGGAAYREEHMIEFGNGKYEKDQAGDKGSDSHLRILSYSIKEDEKKDPEIEAKLIARDIIEKMNSGYLVMAAKKNEKPYLRPVSFSDFCILMDRGSAFDKYQKVFNDLKLPIYVENDVDISSNDIVLVLTNLLRMIDFIKTDGFDYKDEYFKKAWLSLARSFIFKYDDEKIYQIFKNGDLAHEDIVSKIRGVVLDNDYRSSYELFEKLIFELDIYSKCIFIGDIEKNHKYLDYFLMMYKSMSDLGYSLSDFISFMENVDDYDLDIKLSSTGTSSDSIRIMNIHKSKGLEFNIVYLAGTYKQFNNQESKEGYSMSQKFGLIMKKGPDKANIVKIANSEYERNEDISEKIRQLYVALTRTREQLIIPLEIDDETKDETIDITMINAFLKDAYDRYSKGTIDYEAFLSTLKGKGFEPTYQFISLKEEGKRSIPLDEASDYFVEIGNRINDATEFKSFKDMLLPFINCSKFVTYSLFETDETPVLNIPSKEVEHHDLLVKPFPIEFHKIEALKASKPLNLSALKENLEFGTKMHFLLETTDFLNPDYSDLSEKEKRLIENFLSTPFMKNAKNGKICKEYEYHDEKNNLNGTIDLMIIYPDHIDVIDYKTKNIDDDSYDKQIKTYMDYIIRTFDKKTNGYLYSLLTGEYKIY